MSVEVETKDSAALTEEELEEMALMGGSFDAPRLLNAKQDWVLCTTAKMSGKLNGFTFSTLERIGGTPCVLFGLMSIKRSPQRDQVLKGLLAEAYHRALMAFPDEDVVVGSRFVSAHGLEAFKNLSELIPRPDHRAVGEERAWGRRLARRFGVDTNYDEKTFIVKKKGLSGFLDHESSKPEKIKPEIAALFNDVPAGVGACLIVHGWTMTEDLLKLGKH
ncbi:MAG: hypothetical protein WCG40_00170 [Actinomycetes bacterium]